ncbi:hypothetical protein TWF192_005323 [Orbilia oligospora]|uniref:Uncharacterized protein n=1 Tax=Orbilia oligospora TaxID=2813651 RepID=A0A6G1MA70_ORBOL|nr:hypothetical protein TWF191_008631 [Orbilia oligospora]KAF3250301.1 hypothetical protein TWF192_005323 [Orbilia oligospora]
MRSTTLLLFIFFDLYIHITIEAPTSESITATSAPQTTSSAQEPTWSSTFSNYSAGFSSKVPPPTLISPAKATPRAGRVPSNFFYDEKGLRIKCRQSRHETLDRIPLSVKLASENGDFTWTWGSTRLDFTVPTRDLVPALSAPYFVEGPNGELEHTWDTTNGISSEFWSMATWNRRNPGQTEREWDHTSSESLDFWKTAHWNINRPKRRDLGVGENETGLDGNVDVNPRSDKLNAPSEVLNEGSD